MARGSKRLRRSIADMDLDVEAVSLDEAMSTSQMAADALGCTVAQIAKSFVFTGDAPVVVVSRDKRVNPKKLSEHLGFEVRIADAAAVRRNADYVIGGVPPFAHDEDVRVLLDGSLLRFDDVWTAAGTPHSVMRMWLGDIRDVVGGDFVDVAK